GARRVDAAVGLDQQEITIAADPGDLVHRDLEPGRGRLLLEQRAQGVAGDPLGEAGEVRDVLAVEHLTPRGELLEQKDPAAIAGGEDAGGVAGGSAAHDEDVPDV